MLSPGCLKPTAGVSGWAQCGHCGDPLTRLGLVQQEVRYYSTSLITGLCLPQIQVTQKAGAGHASPTPAVKELPSGLSDLEFSEAKAEEDVEKARGLARDPEVVGVLVSGLWRKSLK